MRNRNLGLCSLACGGERVLTDARNQLKRPGPSHSNPFPLRINIGLINILWGPYDI